MVQTNMTNPPSNVYLVNRNGSDRTENQTTHEKVNV